VVLPQVNLMSGRSFFDLRFVDNFFLFGQSESRAISNSVSN